MKIVYLFNGRLPTDKAHGVQVIKSCEAFARAGADVELVIPHRENSITQSLLEYYGVAPIFKLRKVWAFDPMCWVWFPERPAFYAQSITSLAAIFALVVLHRYSRDTVFYARDWPTLFLLSFLGRPYVAEVHDYRMRSPHWNVRRILRKANCIVVNSPGTLKLLKEHYAFPAEKVLVAPNGVDTVFFNISADKEEVRSRLHMPVRAFIIGYVGSLETVGISKGIPMLVEAFCRIATGRDDVFLYIVGGPSDAVMRFKEQAVVAGIPTELVVFTGHVPYLAVPEYLRAMDVVVIPYGRNRHSITTSPIKLFEFLAAGKAIAAADLPSLRMYLDEQTAVFFRPDDSDDLSRALQELISDQNMRECLEQCARQRAERYLWPARARTILKFIAIHS